MIDAVEAMRKLTLNMVRYSGIAPLARPFFGGIGVILMLHRVTAAPMLSTSVNRHLAVHPDFVDKLISDMKRGGYEFIAMDDVHQRVQDGSRGGRFAAITADDGYRDNFLEALPVLERHDAPFTVYVAPGLINRTVDLWWELVERIVDARDIVCVPTENGTVTLDCATLSQKLVAKVWLQRFLTTTVGEDDQRNVVRHLARSVGLDPEAPSRNELMNWDEIRELSRHPLATIGAHTLNHYNLHRLPETQARREIDDCVDILEQELGARFRHMAYPYGYAAAVGAREVALAREAGFVSAVTTRHGVIHADHAQHMQALPRISVNGRYQHLGYMRTMLCGVTTPLANAGKMVVSV